MVVKVKVAVEGQAASESEEPVFRQIERHLMQAIASGKLQPGDRLPTVRGLACSLAVSTGTVMRAYQELGQSGVIQSRRGGGTVVAAKVRDPRLLAVRQSHLSAMVGDTVLKALSLSYGPEEIEAAFYVHLDRWREERKGKAQSVN